MILARWPWTGIKKVEQVVADTGFLEVLVEVLGFLAAVRMVTEIAQEALLEAHKLRDSRKLNL